MQNDVWNPRQYEKFKDQRAKPFHDLLALVDPEGVRRAIDLGCGTGELTAVIQEKIPRAEVLGIDRSPAMLEGATRLETPLLRFERKDLTGYEPSGTFDLVFSNAALQWIPDHESFFPRVLGWVSPRGQVAIQMPYNFDHPSHRIAHEISKEFPPLQELSLPSRSLLRHERYSEILAENGFLEQRCRIEIYLHPMPSGSEVFEWTKGTTLNFYERHLAPGDFEAFKAIYRERLLKEIGTGPYLYAFKRLLLWGRKA